MKLVFHCFLGAVVAAVMPVLLYALNRMLPNPLLAVLSPVNDSPWELSKAIFWSGLAGFLLMRRWEGRADACGFCVALFVPTALCCIWFVLFPAAAQAIVWAVSAILGAGLYALFLRRRRSGSALLWYLPALLLGIAFLLFTTMPPAGRLFTETSGLPAMAAIPY